MSLRPPQIHEHPTCMHVYHLRDSRHRKGTYSSSASMLCGNHCPCSSVDVPALLHVIHMHGDLHKRLLIEDNKSLITMHRFTETSNEACLTGIQSGINWLISTSGYFSVISIVSRPMQHMAHMPPTLPVFALRSSTVGTQVLLFSSGRIAW